LPVFTSPTWWKRKGDIGNLPVCDHIASSKSVQTFFHTQSASFIDDPAYITIASDGKPEDDNTFKDNKTRPRSFAVNVFPGVLINCRMRISSNSLNKGFGLWLARDGLDTLGHTNPAVLVKQLFFVHEKTEPEYTVNPSFEGFVQMFSGHSHALALATTDGVLPTGSIRISVATSIYYGGAGS